MLALTHNREILPGPTVNGPGRAQAAQAAHDELKEVRQLLSHPGPLLASPRMRRRYTEAVQWAAQYDTNTKD